MPETIDPGALSCSECGDPYRRRFDGQSCEQHAAYWIGFAAGEQRNRQTAQTNRELSARASKAEGLLHRLAAYAKKDGGT